MPKNAKINAQETDVFRFTGFHKFDLKPISKVDDFTLLLNI